MRLLSNEFLSVHPSCTKNKFNACNANICHAIAGMQLQLLPKDPIDHHNGGSVGTMPATMRSTMVLAACKHRPTWMPLLSRTSACHTHLPTIRLHGTHHAQHGRIARHIVLQINGSGTR
jgi:hypothetical protein